MESRALLIHRGEGSYGVDVVLHNVIKIDGKYALAAGKVIDDQSVSELVNILTRADRMSPTILPENILINNTHLVCWWRKAEEGDFVYKVGTKSKRIKVNYPTLIFFAMAGRLCVAASKVSKRPTQDTELYFAPVMCLDRVMEICTGNMVLPDMPHVDNICKYESFFYDGANTHVNQTTIKSCSTEEEMIEFYKSNGHKPFPKSSLVDSYQTFGDFIKRLMARD